MAKSSLVFFGTGPVAAKSLQKLAEKFNIELVITKPKKKHHKYPAPVEELSKTRTYKIAFVESSQDIMQSLKTLKPVSEAGVVIDFGLILSNEVINYFRCGIINSHFSLLPKWRGADPITHAILNGDKKTGVSLMKIVEKLDEGPLIIQKSLPIEKKDNQGTLTNKLVALSDSLLEKYLPLYISGEIKLKPQPENQPSYSRKLLKGDGLIDWDKPAVQLEREIRAYAGWPKSRAKINNIDCIILEAEVNQEDSTPGKITSDKSSLIVGCKKGSLSITKLQPAGKNPMTAGEFIRGYLK